MIVQDCRDWLGPAQKALRRTCGGPTIPHFRRTGAASREKKVALPNHRAILLRGGSSGEVDAGLRIPVRMLRAVHADAVDVGIRAAGRLPAVPGARTARHAHRSLLLDGFAADAARAGCRRAQWRRPIVGYSWRELLMLRHEPILHGRQARQRESFLVHRQWMIGSASDV